MPVALLFFFLLISQLSAGQTGVVEGKAGNKRIIYKPEIFSRKFSSKIPYVLKINPGDTISTESIDAGGFDKQGIKKSERGNPLTGPFYIEGTKEGDIIAVNLLKVSLNRNYATTLEGFVPRSMPDSIAKKAWKNAKLVKWNIDLGQGTASPALGHEHLQNFMVTLHPFLGCIGVAPPNDKEIPTYDSGPFGGNLDFKRLTGASTIYLPVFHEGAYLFLGDGHALQGDGEITGDALETSMDIEFTVHIIRASNIRFPLPRAEDSTFIMTIGLGKNLDDALKEANLGMLKWLQEDYLLSLQEATQVMGTSVKYIIAEVADPKVEIVAMIKKDVLKGLNKNR